MHGSSTVFVSLNFSAAEDGSDDHSIWRIPTGDLISALRYFLRTSFFRHIGPLCTSAQSFSGLVLKGSTADLASLVPCFYPCACESLVRTFTTRCLPCEVDDAKDLGSTIE